MGHWDFFRRGLADCLTAAVLAGCGGTQGPMGFPAQRAVPLVPQWRLKGQARAECPLLVDRPTCTALRVNHVPNSSGPTGWLPADLQARYATPSSKGSGQIVAIVDAYDNPNVASDLAAYRSEFGLGTANFTKYNENGQQRDYPSGSPAWGAEEDLDVEMVSAVCPKCTIYLIEANTSDSADLDTAEVTAVTLGAHIVSNSWICYGSNSCVDAKDFSTKGVLFLGSSGDDGDQQNGSPESLPTVVSVGGTQLTAVGSKYSESLWNDSGGGCSNNGSGVGEPKPKWQHDPDCAYRTDVDVSSEAGCSPGVAEYDTYGASGWFQECGTSVASPLNAGILGLAGNAQILDAAKRFWTLEAARHRKYLHHPSGSGSCGSYLCGDGRYKKYYSGPGGWGTPNGINAY